jgi:hypothetical protein
MSDRRPAGPSRRAAWSGERHRRGQLSLSVVEAAVGLLVVVAASTTFVVGLPATGATAGELSVLAADGVAALDATTPDGEGASRLAALARDRSGFVTEEDEAAEQLRALYPAGVRFRLETPHGAVGWPHPPRGPVGTARTRAANTTVTLWVWYR